MRRIKWTAAKAPEYICARHGKARRDVEIRGFYLCDTCVDLLKEGIFGNLEPSYRSDVHISGFCAYCGNSTNVSQGFWYLCLVCERIVRSYATERAATQLIVDWWEQNRHKNECLCNIRLEQTDIVKLMSFESHRKWKLESANSNPDFVGIDERSGEKIFAIEMKSGKNAIHKMSAFQLDVADCDDILKFVQALRVPSYLIHVWVVDEYAPQTPTVRKVALDFWWMSVIDMETSFKKIDARHVERRPAAYFKRTGFRLKEDFLRHICSNELNELAITIKQRLPTLYVLPTKATPEPQSTVIKA